ncbi:MAG: DNA gyrase subunit A [Myxococcota bacterium]|jgi:DNA gyrase subunit A|nr:DNA gyrase subunit A [Myxococcota bacterium]
MADSQLGQVVPVNIEQEIQDSYMAYAMSVIVGRALPDVRDGLKPVHRRILFAMHEMGNTYNHAYKKSARVVGDVIGKYHPHGDSAVYDALVRLAQPFNMQVPLVDGQGNFGSVDGDPPAAMRYTEVRMAKVCGEVLADLEKETVDYAPNYDGSELEPLVLPTKVPNLLVNGSNGIAVGMATNIPPHNLGEVLDAVIAIIEQPKLSFSELMAFIPGPDFPTGGTIHGRQGIVEAYRTGRGVVRVRAKTHVEDDVNGREAIIITELPYQVNKARLIEKMAQLVHEKRIEGIHDLRDESDRSGMRVVIELKHNGSPELILNQLFRFTPMQSSFGINTLAIVAGQPKVLSLREVIDHFIDFRRDVTLRRTAYLLRKARERAHILEGLKIALDHIDEVIQLIRESANAAEAKQGLCTRFGLSEVQAQAILDLRLQRLTALERDKILEELREVMAEIERYKEILASREVLDALIIDELNKVREQYRTPRRTEIVESEGEISFEDLIADEAMIVALTHQNYIKRIPLAEYRTQRRGGRGKSAMNTKEDDFVVDLFVANSKQRLFVFTTNGRVFSLLVYELPVGQRASRGRPIITLLPRLEEGEGIASVLPIPNEDQGLDVISVTQNGIAKKTELTAFRNMNVAGLRAVTIREGDQLISVRLVEPKDSILLATRDGLSIHFQTEDVRATGRGAMGVTGIRLREGDAVIGMEIIKDANADLLTVTSKGYGKRTAISEHRIQSRGGIGIITIKTGERNGDVVAVLQVDGEHGVLLVTDRGTVIRTRVSEIRETGRNAMGVKLIRVEDDEQVVAVAKVVENDEEDESNGKDGSEDGLAEDDEALAVEEAEAEEDSDEAVEQDSEDEAAEPQDP